MSFLVYSISFFVLCEEVDRGRRIGSERGEKRLKFSPQTQSFIILNMFTNFPEINSIVMSFEAVFHSPQLCKAV